jgi:hypothetical protein
MAAGAAQAHTPALFHSEVEPTTLTVRTDGTEGTAQAHHVFVVSGAPITCEGIEGHGTVATKTSSTVVINAKYTNCTFLGVNVTVNMNGCAYEFDANGTVKVINAAGKNCSTSPISYNASGLCEVKVGPQTLTGIKYTNINSESEVTSEASVKNIAGTKSGFFCPGGSGAFTTGEYTTGNAIITGETDPTNIMKKIWWTATIP